MSVAIKVQELSKKYIIRHEGKERYIALRDVITNSFLSATQRVLHPFTRLGIIGRNGAGKSTLLKLLSRITEPSEGRITLRGRVSSLLEVGTGFHPELTGKENIYLNGAVLGMSRAEINSKFDEIVAFSEVEKFLDTPVKRYSSGMQVRLAFSVAAHLEPEILLVDEVLAVGDAAFQKKCLGKMEDVASEGRTIIFVSHNMGAINTLCSRCILLNNGKIGNEGNTSEVVLSYYSSTSNTPSYVDYGKNQTKVGDDLAVLIKGQVENISGELASEVSVHESLRISMVYQVYSQTDALIVPNFHVKTSDGSYAFCLNCPDIKPLSPGIYEVTMEIPGGLLNEGTYFVGLALTTYSKVSHHVNCWDENALSFVVTDPYDLNSNRYGYTGIIPGPVRPALNWSFKEVF